MKEPKLNIPPEEEKKLRTAIDDMLPDEENIKDKIIHELSKVIETLGGMSDILCVVGSYGDTQSNSETLESLIEWNKIYLPQKKDGKYSLIYNLQ